jgi:hypothetical protein
MKAILLVDHGSRESEANDMRRGGRVMMLERVSESGTGYRAPGTGP